MKRLLQLLLFAALAAGVRAQSTPVQPQPATAAILNAGTDNTKYATALALAGWTGGGGGGGSGTVTSVSATVPSWLAVAGSPVTTTGTLALTWNGGTGVDTWFSSPSSANLLAAMTNETGTGLLVFGTGPTISNLTASGTTTISGTGGLTIDNGSSSAGAISNSGGGAIKLAAAFQDSAAATPTIIGQGLFATDTAGHLAWGSKKASYTIVMGSMFGGTITASTNYYMSAGTIGITLSSLENEGRYKYYVPISGTITSVQYYVYAAGGSATAVTCDVFLNNSTSVGATTSFNFTSFPINQVVGSLSQAVTAWNGTTGDYIEFRVQAPVGLTSCTAVSIWATVVVATTPN